MRTFEIAQLKTTTFHTGLHSEFKVVHFSPTQIQQNKKPQELGVFQVWTGECALRKKKKKKEREAMRRNWSESTSLKNLAPQFPDLKALKSVAIFSTPNRRWQSINTQQHEYCGQFLMVSHCLELSRWITPVLSQVHTMTCSISALCVNPTDVALHEGQLP